MAQVFPRQMSFQSPPVVPSCRSFLFKQGADASTYSPSSTVVINLPKLARSYLSKESYLKWTVKNTSTASNGTTARDVRWDQAGCYSAIKKIEVYGYRNSELLESHNEVGVLQCLLFDVSCDENDMLGHSRLVYGCTERCLGEELAGDSSKTYCFPLLNSFLTNLSQKYVPLVNGFSINITLASASEAFIGQADTDLLDFEISNVSFCAQIVELSSASQLLLESSLGSNPMIVPAKGYRHYVATQADDNGSLTVNIGLNASSVSNLWWVQRESAKLSNPCFPVLSNRMYNYLSSWLVQVGAAQLPQTSGITGAAESYTELCKSFHRWNVDSQPSLMTYSEYTRHKPTFSFSSSVYDVSSLGAAAWGLDFEPFPNRTLDLVSGVSTVGQNFSVILTNDSTNVSNVTASRLDFFVEIHTFISVIPNVTTTVSF